MAEKVEWLALAQRATEKGIAIFDGSQVQTTEHGPSDPKVVAITLLARTLHNAEAAIVLVDKGFVIEARTLVRCCFENLFWAAAVARKGRDFITQMRLDDAAHRIKRGKALLGWLSRQSKTEDFEPELARFIESLEASDEKFTGISLHAAASAGGIGDAYIIYRELSTDAAHPSATSLSRYVTWADDAGFTVHGLPVGEHREDEDTLELLCNALIGSCAATEEVLGQTELGEPLTSLAETFRGYSDSNKRARDRGQP